MAASLESSIAEALRRLPTEHLQELRDRLEDVVHVLTTAAMRATDLGTADACRAARSILEQVIRESEPVREIAGDPVR